MAQIHAGGASSSHGKMSPMKVIPVMLEVFGVSMTRVTKHNNHNHYKIYKKTSLTKGEKVLETNEQLKENTRSLNSGEFSGKSPATSGWAKPAEGGGPESGQVAVRRAKGQ